MKQIVILIIIFFSSCCAEKEKNLVMESELERSRWIMEEEMNSKFKCYKQTFIDSDSTFNPYQLKGPFQEVYMDFSKLMNFRDSIAGIKSSLNKNAWMKILFQFSQKSASVKGSKSAIKIIKSDLKFLNENFESIPESEFGELYKHIVERWTNEIYKSFMSNAAIDSPPCRR